MKSLRLFCTLAGCAGLLSWSSACLANPLIANGGCVFPNGIRVAYFASPPIGYQYIKVGSRLSIAVLNGNTAVYRCSGGQGLTSGNLSMTVSQIDTDTNSPFAKFILYGSP